ncbi:MAG: SCO family protein [Ardenticatenaceae bacterium]|nr:SCO family protein [Ardenticatenaceae bacterium]MCB9445782.1 SCO family protein [Ardenticatenaceae bacterium]
MKRISLIFLTIVVVLTTVLAACTPYEFHGTILQSNTEAADFTLMSSNGQRVSLDNFRGKLVVLYFGYTFCPDVCPATLVEIAGAMDILGEDARNIQTIMISVDPERDTPEQLAEYVAHFDPTFLGVTGTPEQIAEIATLYGIYYEKHEGTAASGYLIDHTATVMVVDQDGYLKLLLPFGTTAQDMADDLAYLLTDVTQ